MFSCPSSLGASGAEGAERAIRNAYISKFVAMQYSFSLTTFSPSGKLVQIEYALNAVAAGSTSLGIKVYPHRLLSVYIDAENAVEQQHSSIMKGHLVPSVDWNSSAALICQRQLLTRSVLMCRPQMELSLQQRRSCAPHSLTSLQSKRSLWCPQILGWHTVGWVQTPASLSGEQGSRLR